MTLSNLACFNTQPPEGGWPQAAFTDSGFGCFNTQPPEGGWDIHGDKITANTLFQHTAARRRLARLIRFGLLWAGFNTQPPEGGWPDGAGFFRHAVSFQHTAARRRLVRRLEELGIISVFQHTAARRRLVCDSETTQINAIVSTHSRPKAAGLNDLQNKLFDMFQHTAARRRLDKRTRCPEMGKLGFNTQPPEGGWILQKLPLCVLICFNTQPPEGGWPMSSLFPKLGWMFQHTAARRRLGSVCVS